MPMITGTEKIKSLEADIETLTRLEGELQFYIDRTPNAETREIVAGELQRLGMRIDSHQEDLGLLQMLESNRMRRERRMAGRRPVNFKGLTEVTTA